MPNPNKPPVCGCAGRQAVQGVKDCRLAALFEAYDDAIRVHGIGETRDLAVEDYRHVYAMQWRAPVGQRGLSRLITKAAVLARERLMRRQPAPEVE